MRRRLVTICVCLLLGAIVAACNCQNSTPSATNKTVDSVDTPTATWTAILAAATAGDVAGIRRLCTEQGFASISETAGSEPLEVALRRWGPLWSPLEVRWMQEAAVDSAKANLGPEAKEKGLVFRKTDGQWLLDRLYQGL